MLVCFEKRKYRNLKHTSNTVRTW